VSWALNWLWNDPDITLVLSGMNEDNQLEENLSLAEAALPNNFSDPQLQAIADVKEEFNKSYKIPCTGCNYCMPCPVKINIPACFEAYNKSYAVGRGAGVYAYMMTVGALGEFPHYASDCSDCGKCVKECPQNIDITKDLKAVKRRLQIPGMKKIMPLMSKMMAR
jgi:predicted aldo/keto reductase-like oxidoreductase